MRERGKGARNIHKSILTTLAPSFNKTLTPTTALFYNSPTTNATTVTASSTATTTAAAAASPNTPTAQVVSHTIKISHSPYLYHHYHTLQRSRSQKENEWGWISFNVLYDPLS